MFKVKDEIIKYFYRENLTGCDQLTYIALRTMCDERGVVNGCYYKEIVEMIGYSEGQFYRSLYALEEKGLIDVSDNRKEKTIVIIGNVFSNYEASNQYTDYCDMNLKLYDVEAYKELRAGARRILEYFVFRVLKQKYKTDETIRAKKIKSGEKVHDNNLNSLLYALDKKYAQSEIHMFEKIKNEVFGMDGITFRMFRSYLKELKEAGFISVGYGIDVNGTRYDIITVSAEMLHTPTIEVTEHGVLAQKVRNSKHNHHLHFVKYLCRMFKLVSDKINLANVADLFVQYRIKAEKQQKNLYAVIKTALSSFSKENNCLDSRIIHSLIKRIIAKDYSNTLLVY